MGLQEGVEPSSPRYDGGARPTTGACATLLIDRRVAGVEPACASVAGPYEPSVEAFQSFDRRRGALTGTRTRDLALTKGVLFQLSYEGGAGSFARGTYGLCTDPHRSDVAPYCLFTDRLLYPS